MTLRCRILMTQAEIAQETAEHDGIAAKRECRTCVHSREPVGSPPGACARLPYRWPDAIRERTTGDCGPAGKFYISMFD
jgi:hypothetical protein